MTCKAFIRARNDEFWQTSSTTYRTTSSAKGEDSLNKFFKLEMALRFRPLKILSGDVEMAALTKFATLTSFVFIVYTDTWDCVNLYQRRHIIYRMINEIM